MTPKESLFSNDLEKVEIFDKYDNFKLYDAPPEELYEKFENFYNKLL